MATTITLSVSGDDLLTIFGLSFGPLVMSTTTLVYPNVTSTIFGFPIASWRSSGNNHQWIISDDLLLMTSNLQ